MKPTVKYIEKKFDEFNIRMFGGRLPKLPIELSDASTFLGQCVFQQQRMSDGTMRYGNFRLRINTRVDYPEQVIEDTIIHEMIHYFILWSGLIDTSAHGDIFKALMRSINNAHNRNISISHRNTPEQREQAVSTRRTWHIIAVIHMKSGQRGIKVLPRVAPKVIEYHRVVTSQSTVSHVELYLHDNPFFNRYPTSAALRVYDIDRNVLEEHLKGAQKIAITDKGLKVIG